jgi:hypothetical protein
MPRIKKIDMNLSMLERVHNISFGNSINEEYSSKNMTFSNTISELSYKLKELAPLIVDDVLCNKVSAIAHIMDRMEYSRLTDEDKTILKEVFYAGVKNNLVNDLQTA